MDTVHMGGTIRALMESRGDSVKDLADRIGYTRAGVDKFLKKKHLRMDILKKVADAYKIDIGYFFAGNINQKGHVNAIGEAQISYGTIDAQNRTKILEAENEGLKTEVKALREQIDTLKEMIQLLKDRGR